MPTSESASPLVLVAVNMVVCIVCVAVMIQGKQ